MRSPQKSGILILAPRVRVHAFSFKSHMHREHTTWALTITPHPLRSAGALSADLQALVIQVLHVPDTAIRRGQSVAASATPTRARPLANRTGIVSIHVAEKRADDQ